MPELIASAAEILFPEFPLDFRSKVVAATVCLASAVHAFTLHCGSLFCQCCFSSYNYCLTLARVAC